MFFLLALLYRDKLHPITRYKQYTYVLTQGVNYLHTKFHPNNWSLRGQLNGARLFKMSLG